MLRIFLLRVAAAAVLGASLLAHSLATAQDTRPFKIGMLHSYKGVFAASAESQDRGFQLALEEFGNKVGTRPIEIIRADDELTPNVGVERYNKLIQSDKVDVVVGVISSAVGIALSELADKNKKPIVFMQAHADGITGKYCSPYVARTSFSANAYQYASGVYWASKGLKRVVTMGPDYAGGHAFLDDFKKGFEDSGGTVVQQIWTPFQKTKDWSAALLQAKSDNVQAIYAFYGVNEAVQVVKQHADFGLRKTLPLIGDQWVYDEMLWPALGDLVDGVQFTTTHFPGIDTPVNKKFVSSYEKKYHAAPDVNVVTGYDNGMAVMLALKKLNWKMPEDGAQFISAMRSLEFESPRGKIKFNKSNSAQLEKLYVVKIVKGSDGKYSRVLVDSFPGAPDVPGCDKAF